MSQKDILNVEPLIRIIRGQRVILDADLARVYGVSTKVFNQAIKRNKEKFPRDFMFQLTMFELRQLKKTQHVVNKEDMNLRSQIVTSSLEYGGRRYLPFAFTEHGAIMAANVLNSPSAVQMSVFVVRAFMRMRELLSGSKELSAQLAALEKKLTDRLDVHEVAIVDILKRIMIIIDSPLPPPVPSTLPKPKIGF